MKNKAFVIILTCLVFFVVCAIGLKELFSVRDITIEYSVFDQESVEDVTEILEKYRGKNLFFVDVKKIEEEIFADRYLKVTAVRKVYPCEISVSLSERNARFFYEEKGAYGSDFYLFDNDFFVIGKTKNKPCTSFGIIGVGFIDKLNNVEPTFSLKKTVELPYGFNLMLSDCVLELEDFSSNIASVNFVGMPEPGNYRLVLKTVEGVAIEIRNAERDLSKKIKKGVSYYKSLSESERIENVIIVYSESNVIRCDYTKNAEVLI